MEFYILLKNYTKLMLGIMEMSHLLFQKKNSDAAIKNLEKCYQSIEIVSKIY